MSVGAVLLGLTIGAGFVVAPAARADELTVCPSGLTGVATEDTSCAFAENVRAAWLARPGAVVPAYSPVTQQSITMQCSSWATDTWPEAQRCVGVNSAGVGLIVFIAPGSGGPGSPAGLPAMGPAQPMSPAPPVGIDGNSPNLPSVNTPNIGCTWVDGYTRSNGTRVSGYFRC